MQHGIYSWTVSIAETQSSWIFVGVAQADDPNDVAWRSTGRMLYCLDSRFFHMGSGQNHPHGDRKICSGTCIRVVLDCTGHTLAFGINNEKPQVLFRDLAAVAYVPAVDLRDCGDKVRLVSSDPHSRVMKSSRAQAAEGSGEVDPAAPTIYQGPSASDRRLTAPELPPSSSDSPGSDLGPGITRASVSGEMRGRPLSNNEVHSALGISHHPSGPGASNARMSQPRQSQGSQGGAGVAAASNLDRGLMTSGSNPMSDAVSLLEEEREPSWEPQSLNLRGDMVPPNS